MNIGDLRHVVYLQAPTATQTTRGAEAIVWTDSPALRARVRTVGGDERTTSEQMIAIAQHQVELRWPLPTGTTISTKHRVKWTQQGVTRYFGINSIGEPDNRMRMIVLSCTELVGESRGL